MATRKAINRTLLEKKYKELKGSMPSGGRILPREAKPVLPDFPVPPIPRKRKLPLKRYLA